MTSSSLWQPCYREHQHRQQLMSRASVGDAWVRSSGYTKVRNRNRLKVAFLYEISNCDFNVDAARPASTRLSGPRRRSPAMRAGLPRAATCAWTQPTPPPRPRVRFLAVFQSLDFHDRYGMRFLHKISRKAEASIFGLHRNLVSTVIKMMTKSLEVFDILKNTLLVFENTLLNGVEVMKTDKNRNKRKNI